MALYFRYNFDFDVSKDYSRYDCNHSRGQTHKSNEQSQTRDIIHARYGGTCKETTHQRDVGHSLEHVQTNRMAAIFD